MSASFPTPWTFHAEDACEDQPILDANGNEVLVRDSGAYPPDLETFREIVEAVNWYSDWGALSAELERLHAERDRLRDIVKRMADLSESLLANYEYRYREDANSMAFVENTRRFLREARAAIGEDRP